MVFKYFKEWRRDAKDVSERDDRKYYVLYNVFLCYVYCVVFVPRCLYNMK